jgi:hypothetical protein
VNGAFLTGRGFSRRHMDELAGLWRDVHRGQVFPMQR